MTHPTREELIEFIYDELDADRKATLEDHVESCAECQATLASWGGIRRQLQAGDATIADPRMTFAGAALLRGVIAAVLLVGLGYGLARVTAPSESRLRGQVTSELQTQFRNELRAELAKFTIDQAAREQEYQQQTARLIGQLEIRQVADYSGLRKDVETVAMRTQEEFDRLTGVESVDAKGPQTNH
ncbi:MAG TPA: zf-HC2 domain-containing protein [Humisphaera sp.]|jgi:hypothetical protein|nr:zf-HC2 domain-containing protein [Humisphaera sp.]